MYGPSQPTSFVNLPYMIQQPELAHEWIYTLETPYLEPTIYVTQIGEKVLSEPTVASTFWQHLDEGRRIRIIFENFPCKGFVIIHRS